MFCGHLAKSPPSESVEPVINQRIIKAINKLSIWLIWCFVKLWGLKHGRPHCSRVRKRSFSEANLTRPTSYAKATLRWLFLFRILSLVFIGEIPFPISDGQETTVINSHFLSNTLIHDLIHCHNKWGILLGIHRQVIHLPWIILQIKEF